MTPAAQDRWSLSVVGHPSTPRLGAEMTLSPRSGIVIGRGRDYLGAGTLDHQSIASPHAVIEVRSTGQVALHGLTRCASTTINGRPAPGCDLEDEDVVGVGEVLLQLRRTNDSFVPRSHPRIVGKGQAHARLVEALERATTHDGPVLVAGEAGCDQRQLAETLHWERRRPGALVVVDANDSEETAARKLQGARGGTVVVDDLDDTHERTHATTFCAIFERARRMDAGVVLCSRLGRDLGALRFEQEIVVPALRERREDLPLLAAARVRRHAGRDVPLDPEATLAILEYDWPGNLAELDAVVARGLADLGSERVLRLPPLRQAQWRVESSRAAAEPSASPRLGPTWFQMGGAPVVPLENRRAICRVYGALFHQRVQRPGTPVGVPELLAAGWPGERVLPRAGANRVYVALTTLRKLGLRGAMIRTKHGYLLDPELVIEQTDAGAA